MKIDEFIESLRKLNIDITSRQLEQLEEYYNLLVEWNEKINLTRITLKDDVYLKHFYDSATIVKVIDLNKINNFCDFGTGAGFPGIVIKILFPSLNVTLVDSLNKRINFLNIVIEKLKLEKIVAIHSRIEDFARTHREKFDLVTARAVASLPVLLEYATGIIKKDKYFIAMKASIDEELEQSINAQKILKLKLIDKNSFLLPKENSVRNILLFQKQERTNLKYPRNPSEIKKKPL